MSILDGMPTSQAEMREIVGTSADAVQQFLGAAELTPRGQSIVDLMNEGLSLADIFQIPKDQRDALLVQGIRQVQSGDIAGAQGTLTMLYHLEPTDERVVYALATTYQTQENYAVAGKLYVAFVAMDATNPDGYLRLGECFLANREYDRARACFEVGKGEAQSAARGDRVAHADQMLALLGDRTDLAA